MSLQVVYHQDTPQLVDLSEQIQETCQKLILYLKEKLLTSSNNLFQFLSLQIKVTVNKIRLRMELKVLDMVKIVQMEKYKGRSLIQTILMGH